MDDFPTLQLPLGNRNPISLPALGTVQYLQSRRLHLQRTGRIPRGCESMAAQRSVLPKHPMNGKPVLLENPVFFFSEG